MAQIGEAVAADLAGGDTSRCPFDCGSTCNATNVFDRADKMGGCMTSGTPTIRYRRENHDYKDDATPIDATYPPRDSSFPNEWGWAAHHLIPVGSLGSHKLRKFLDKSHSGSFVACDVGYDVNGVTNGKWLVGSAKLQADLKDESIIEAVKRECERAGIKVGTKSVYSALSADARQGSEDRLGFKEWLYATMLHYQVQFHDSHSATDGYNDFVKSILNKVWENLRRLHQRCPGGSKCKKAGKKPMAPHRIARRLDYISGRLGRYLEGPPTTWRRPLFTSELSLMLAEEIQRAY